MPGQRRKSKIEYKPQIAGHTPREPAAVGDSGDDLRIEHVIKALDSLRYELRDARDKVSDSLSDYAITGEKAMLEKVANVSHYDNVPKSISFRAYRSLKTNPDASFVKDVFETKSLSAWGDAAVIMVDVFDAVNIEAMRARRYLADGCNDESLIESISEWTGSARMFVVDAVHASVADISPAVREELYSYDGSEVDVQKTSIIRSGKLAGSLKNSVSSLLNMYLHDDNTYVSLMDIDVRTPVSGGGVISSVVDFGREDVADFKKNVKNDLDYRKESFKELSAGIIESMSHLRMAQAVNKEIAAVTGVQESVVDTVIVTGSDNAFDEWIQDPSDTYISDQEDGLSSEEVNTAIDEAINSIEFSENIDWHTKSLHDLLLIDAFTLGGYEASDFAMAIHDHDAAYTPLAHATATNPHGITPASIGAMTPSTHDSDDHSSLDTLGSLEITDLRITGTGDVSETSTGHPFQIGPDSGLNMAIDQNEIMARNNGVDADLLLNWGGSTTKTGGDLSVGGRLDFPYFFGYPDVAQDTLNYQSGDVGDNNSSIHSLTAAVDTHSGWNSSTDKWVVPSGQDGTYLIMWNLMWVASTGTVGGYIASRLHIGSSWQSGTLVESDTTSTIYWHSQAFAIRNLSAGSYVQFCSYMTFGSSTSVKAIYTSSSYTQAYIARIA